jgi:hypothetical protein
MSDSQWLGMVCVLGVGVFQGSFMLPMKRTEHWAFENVWLVFACTAYLVLSWDTSPRDGPAGLEGLRFRQFRIAGNSVRIWSRLGHWGANLRTRRGFSRSSARFAVILGLAASVPSYHCSCRD